jgi:hypothetical protein
LFSVNVWPKNNFTISLETWKNNHANGENKIKKQQIGSEKNLRVVFGYILNIDFGRNSAVTKIILVEITVCKNNNKYEFN